MRANATPAIVSPSEVASVRLEFRREPTPRHLPHLLFHRHSSHIVALSGVSAKRRLAHGPLRPEDPRENNCLDISGGKGFVRGDEITTLNWVSLGQVATPAKILCSQLDILRRGAPLSAGTTSTPRPTSSPAIYRTTGRRPQPEPRLRSSTLPCHRFRPILARRNQPRWGRLHALMTRARWRPRMLAPRP